MVYAILDGVALLQFEAEDGLEECISLTGKINTNAGTHALKSNTHFTT